MAQHRIEGYLSGKADAAWPAALVIRVDDENGTRFLLRRSSHEDVELGTTFGDARRALYAAIRHEKAGGQLPG